MSHLPGGIPRARNSSASHTGRPGAFGSRSFASDGALAIRQRIRAPLKLAWPPSRIKKAATPDRSEATASRRVAVKSSDRGSPQISPMTAESPVHLRPSSIAHSASLASRVSTWMRFCMGNPGGWIRPLSRIAIRSCTHSKGLPVATCASRNPTQPLSRGCAANSSDRVGCGAQGRVHPSPNSLKLARFSPERPPPPATRDRFAATRLTTLLFYFCSLSRESGRRVNPATRMPRSHQGTARSPEPRRACLSSTRQSPCVWN